MDSYWIESFQIVNLVRSEIFSELYLIRVISETGAAVPRLLRRIKKAMFREPITGLKQFRQSLED